MRNQKPFLSLESGWYGKASPNNAVFETADLAENPSPN